MWLTSAGPATDTQLVRAARAHAGEDAVITGLVACRLLGLPYAPGDGAVEVLVPAGRRRTSSPTVLVRPTVRPPTAWSRDGVLVAEPTRAVIDGARRLAGLRAVRALVLDAVRSGRCRLDALSLELEAGASGGSAVVRRVLRDAASGAWSAPEAEVADVARAAADAGVLPPFLLNPTLYVDGRRLGSPDGWFPGLGLGWEVDSQEHHGSVDGLGRTLARHDAFARHGLVLLHATPRRARLVGATYAQVLADAVEARRRAAQPEPSDLVVRPYAPARTPRAA